MKNVKLILQFKGSEYHGWQIQKNAVTIQELMEKAIYKITGEKAPVTGCGRTDAGVHAKGYVCNFYTNSTIPAERFPFVINQKLPCDVVCIGGEEVPVEFHSGKSAVKKRYTYYICTRQFPDIFTDSWHYPHKLDLEKMQKAAEYFVGTHDFIGFASAGYSVKTTVRTIYGLTVSEKDGMFEINITGNGFLYNMVRIISGTLAFAGMGKIPLDEIPDIIKSGDRTRAGITAPPEGLYLSEVYYEE